MTDTGTGKAMAGLKRAIRHERQLLGTVSALAIALALAPARADTRVVQGGQTVTITAASPAPVEWTAVDALYLGNNGAGTLIVSDGGHLTTQTGLLGNVSGSNAGSGTATVSGSTSLWKTTGDLVVGEYFNGALTIENGGTVESANGYIGRRNTGSSSGVVTVTGNNSVWNNSGALYVATGASGGAGGTGTLTIKGGGKVRNTAGFIGNATVTVTGPGSSWENTGALTVGQNAYATLTVADKGTVSSIGDATLTNGAVTISGDGSSWSNSGDVYAGRLYSSATVTLAENGALRVGGGAGTLYLGYLSSNGTLNIGAAPGSAAIGAGKLQAGAVVFGTGGAATLNFNHTGNPDGSDLVFGARISSGSSGDRFVNHYAGKTIMTGASTSFSGTTTISGGTLWIGNGGSGARYSGSIVDNANLGFNHSDSWSFTGAISGTGTLTKTGTGTLTLTGNSSGFAGTTTISGGTLRIGSGGSGARFAGGIDNQTGLAFNHSDSWSFAGAISGAGTMAKAGTGTLTLTADNSGLAGTTTITAGTLRIGDGGAGARYGGNIVNSAALRFDHGDNWAYSGNISGAGTITKIGAGTLTLTGQSTATGTTTISGGALQIGNGGGGARIGGSIVNNAALGFNHNDNWSFTGGISGSGIMTKTGTGTLALTGDSSGFGGLTAVFGGTLSVGVNGVGKLGGTVNVSSGGTLGGSGMVGSDGTTVTIASGGTLAPGNSLGTLSVAGNLDLQQGSRLAFEFGAPGSGFATSGQSNGVAVANELTIAGTTLDVSDAGGFGPGLYRLFDYGTLTETGTGLTLGTTPADTTLSLQRLAGDKRINLINTSGMVLSYWNGNDLATAGTMGGGDGIWSNASAVWTNADGSITAPMQPQPGFGIFGGAAGTVTLDDTDGAVQATGLQFASDGYVLIGDALTLVGTTGIKVGDGSAASAGYTATIDAAIAGSDGLTKTGAGTLVLTADNSYTGGTSLAEGLLSVSNDAKLGDASGGLTFNGGTLQVTGTAFAATDRAIAWGDNGGGFDIVAADHSFAVSQGIVGAGDLLKRGNGTLVLTGANAYGNTLVAAGTLVGNAGSISGVIGNAGKVVFDQTTDASFAGDIGGLDASDGIMLKQGAGTLTLTGISTLDWTIEAGELVSVAERFGGGASITNGAKLSFEQIMDAAYAGQVSGTGAFDKTGTGTLLLTGDSSAFTGTTTVAAGSLIVGYQGSGALGGLLLVQSGGLLGGSGMVGSTTIASGGTLAAGNSIGTLKMAGDLEFQSGAWFQVEIKAGGNTAGIHNDLAEVTGTVTIDGGASVRVRAANGTDTGVTYAPNTTYTILTASDGLHGTFADTVDSNFAFLDAALDYGVNTVYLHMVRNDTEFASVAETGNQGAVAEAVDGLGPGNTIYDAVINLDEDHARAAFDALSGEIHASTDTALIEAGSAIRDAVTDRIRAAFEDVAAVSLPVMAYGEGGPELAAAATDRFAAWGQAFGNWGHTDGDANAARLSRSGGGLITGADAMLGDLARIGILAGYSQTSFDARDRSSSGSSDNYHLGLYGGARWGGLGLRSGLAYTWHDIATERAVVFPGFDDRLNSDHRAGSLQAFGEAGYRFDTASASFEPFANLAYVSLYTKGFSESGGDAALTVASRTTSVTFTTLGLRAATDIKLGGVNATARGTLGWRHASGDVTLQSTHAFAGSSAFTIASVPIARNSAIIEAGLDLDIAAAAKLGLSYKGQFASSAQDHGFNARLGVKF